MELERIQFVGACNPPTDAGRVELPERFLRHAPVLLVDFPGPVSLTQIYGTFNRALLKLQVQLNNRLSLRCCALCVMGYLCDLPSCYFQVSLSRACRAPVYVHVGACISDSSSRPCVASPTP